MVCVICVVWSRLTVVPGVVSDPVLQQAGRSGQPGRGATNYQHVRLHRVHLARLGRGQRDVCGCC